MELAYDEQAWGRDQLAPAAQRAGGHRITQDRRQLGTARITNSPAELRAQIARAGKNPQGRARGDIRLVLGGGHPGCGGGGGAPGAPYGGEGVHLPAREERRKRRL